MHLPFNTRFLEKVFSFYFSLALVGFPSFLLPSLFMMNCTFTSLSFTVITLTFLDFSFFYLPKLFSVFFPESLSFFIPWCYYPFIVGSFLKNLTFQVSIHRLGEIVLNCGNKILFSSLGWTDLCVRHRWFQDNHWFHSQVSSEGGR